VVLAAITNGFRELLLSRGEEVDGATVIRSLIPVSVRPSGDHSPNNQVSALIAELPVGVADPVERLRDIRAQMAGLKESHQAVAASALVGLAGFAPAVMRRMPQRSVNTVTTNVPGPQGALYACGRELLEYVPFVPLGQGMRTGVAILSYHGTISFGVTGDWDTTPDLDVLADGIAHGVEQLLLRPA
jgi:diacylglycerol O-acyltransferase